MTGGGSASSITAGRQARAAAPQGRGYGAACRRLARQLAGPQGRSSTPREAPGSRATPQGHHTKRIREPQPINGFLPPRAQRAGRASTPCTFALDLAFVSALRPTLVADERFPVISPAAKRVRSAAAQSRTCSGRRGAKLPLVERSPPQGTFFAYAKIRLGATGDFWTIDLLLTFPPSGHAFAGLRGAA